MGEDFENVQHIDDSLPNIPKLQGNNGLDSHVGSQIKPGSPTPMAQLQQATVTARETNVS